MTRRVIVLGSVNRDTVVRVDTLPRPGETVLGATRVELAGGKGGNVAAGCAMLGADAWLVGAVGDDPEGRRARAELEADGVHCDALEIVDGPTGTAFIAVDLSGENQIVVSPGANHLLKESVSAAAIARIARRGDITVASLEVPLAVAAAALETARGRGATTILNASPALPVATAALAAADVLVVNSAEFSALDMHIESADVTVLVTRGNAGCEIRRNRSPLVAIPADPVLHLRDTVGAGDAFIAGLCSGLADGLPIESAAALATRVARRAVEHDGARPPLPSIEQLR